METFWQDLRGGVRKLSKTPGFALTAILTLGLGIGANAAMFSAVSALLLRPLPIADIDRVVHGSSLREGFDPFGVSPLTFNALRQRAASFERLGLSTFRVYNMVGDGEPEQIQGAMVAQDYLETLGVQPWRGRLFTPAENQPNGPSVAVLGYGLWQRRYGGRDDVLGRTMRFGDRSATIVGIMPPGFDLPFGSEAWLPLQMSLESLPPDQMAARNYDLVGRLRPGVSVAVADAESKRIAEELAAEHPETQRGWGFTFISMRRHLLGDLEGRIHRSIYALLAAIGFLLLICCVNVACLLLAQGAAREHELTVRRALGALPHRVARQLLTEGLVLALCGGIVGWLAAVLVLPVLSALNPIQTITFATYLRDLRLDGRVLAFTSAVSLLTAVLAGLVPALRAARARDLIGVMRVREQHSGGTVAGRRVLGTLVVGELALAVTLLAGGGLLVHSFLRLQQVDLGFQPAQLLTLQTAISSTRYPDPAQRLAVADQIVETVRALPGVVSAGTTTNLPLNMGSWDSSFEVEGRPAINPAAVPITAHRLVGGLYLETIGVTLVRGRLLTAADNRLDAQPVVVVSEELARQAWGDEDPLGKRVRRVRPGHPPNPWLTVVGVVRNVKEDRFNFRADRAAWYLPYAQHDINAAISVVVKAAGEPSHLASAVRGAIREVLPDQPVARVMTMEEHLADVLATERFSAVLMGTVAALGLGLAALGLYSMLAWSVTQRSVEIGLRMALGATPLSVVGMVLGHGMKLVAVGLALGAIGAVFLTRSLAAVVYGDGASDPGTFAVMLALLIVTGLLACVWPVLRAARTDPLASLRAE